MARFDPAAHTGYLLRRAQQAHAQIWASRAVAEITPVQYGVLALVKDDPGIDQKTIAERLGLDRSTITEVVVRLLRRGYVDRVRTDEDRRRNALRLSASGLATVAEMERVAHEADEKVTRVLSDEERETLDRILRRLLVAQGPARTDRPSFGGMD